MTLLTLAQLCNRLGARLADQPLDESQLLDLATLLMFVQWDLNRASWNGKDRLPNRAALENLARSLHWVQDFSTNASLEEIRDQVDAAHQAAVASIYLLQFPHSSPRSARVGA